MKRKPKHISQEDWDAVDIPELTAKDFKRMRPASEVVPHIVKAYKEGRLKVRGQQKSPTKRQLSIRLSNDIVVFFKSTGRGWQSRMNEALREWIKGRKSA